MAAAAAALAAGPIVKYVLWFIVFVVVAVAIAFLVLWLIRDDDFDCDPPPEIGGWVAWNKLSNAGLFKNGNLRTERRRVQNLASGGLIGQADDNSVDNDAMVDTQYHRASETGIMLEEHDDPTKDAEFCYQLVVKEDETEGRHTFGAIFGGSFFIFRKEQKDDWTTFTLIPPDPSLKNEIPETNPQASDWFMIVSKQAGEDGELLYLTLIDDPQSSFHGLYRFSITPTVQGVFRSWPDDLSCTTPPQNLFPGYDSNKGRTSAGRWLVNKWTEGRVFGQKRDGAPDIISDEVGHTLNDRMRAEWYIEYHNNESQLNDFCWRLTYEVDVLWNMERWRSMVPGDWCSISFPETHPQQASTQMYGRHSNRFTGDQAEGDGTYCSDKGGKNNARWSMYASYFAFVADAEAPYYRFQTKEGRYLYVNDQLRYELGTLEYIEMMFGHDPTWRNRMLFRTYALDDLPSDPPTLPGDCNERAETYWHSDMPDVSSYPESGRTVSLHSAATGGAMCLTNEHGSAVSDTSVGTSRSPERAMPMLRSEFNLAFSHGLCYNICVKEDGAARDYIVYVGGDNVEWRSSSNYTSGRLAFGIEPDASNPDQFRLHTRANGQDLYLRWDPSRSRFVLAAMETGSFASANEFLFYTLHPPFGS